MFLVSVSDLEETKSREVMLDEHTLFREYVEVFLNEILGMLLEHDIDFRIDLIPGVVPISRAPYHMTIQELSNLRL